MTEHKVTGWKKHEIEASHSLSGTGGVSEDIVDVLGESNLWECTCGEEFESLEDAKDHIWEKNR